MKLDEYAWSWMKLDEYGWKLNDNHTIW